MLVKAYLHAQINGSWSSKSPREHDVDLVRRGIAIDYHYIPGYGYTHNGTGVVNAYCGNCRLIRTYADNWIDI